MGGKEQTQQETAKPPEQVRVELYNNRPLKKNTIFVRLHDSQQEHVRRTIQSIELYLTGTDNKKHIMRLEVTATEVNGPNPSLEVRIDSPDPKLPLVADHNGQWFPLVIKNGSIEKPENRKGQRVYASIPQGTDGKPQGKITLLQDYIVAALRHLNEPQIQTALRRSIQNYDNRI